MKFKTKEALAKYTVDYYLRHRVVPKVAATDVPERLRPPAACFVSIYIRKDLRGCIGTYFPVEPLYQNIIHNAAAAISSDWRFAPVTLAELPDLEAEVSVLTLPQEHQVKNLKLFLKYLRKNKPGVIVENNGQRALYLPQVWQHYQTPQDFLSDLCLKANLPADTWQLPQTHFLLFQNQKNL